MNRQVKLLLLILIACCLTFLSTSTAQKKNGAAPARKIDDAALRKADERPGEWITHGRNYAETRFSPLKQINDGNIGTLGLAWSFDTETNRGLEATPLIVDGVMYTTGSWSIVFAIDARTGKQLWKYDPQVPHRYGPKACCDVVNRGVAVYRGKVYVGTLDGRLIALDAATGKPVWDVVTVDQSRPYTITAAPRVVKGKVIIGNGGAEFGVRGYVSAYDAETGKMAWRFYTVPGDPSKPFESAAMEKAAKTWKGEWWKVGGGGTVWDSVAYDPDLDLLYVGTGNGSPWNPYVRSNGEGDNLYLSSILALDPIDGTTNLAKGMPNSISVIAAAQVPDGAPSVMRHLPSHYSHKIAYGPAVAEALRKAGNPCLLDLKIAEVLRLAARALDKHVRDLVVMTLDRPRHADIIQGVRAAGAGLRMVSDGDITAAVAPSMSGSGVDLYIGMGGSPEAVLAAAALRCLGGDMQVRMWFHEEGHRAEVAKQVPPEDLSRVYQADELVVGESALFCATGISDSALLPGIRVTGHRAETHSILMRARSRTVRHIHAIHDMDHKLVPLRSR